MLPRSFRGPCFHATAAYADILKFFCMHKNLVNARGSCACTRSNLTTLSANGDYGKNIENHKVLKGHSDLPPRKLAPYMMTTTKHTIFDRPTHFVASAAAGIKEDTINSLCSSMLSLYQNSIPASVILSRLSKLIDS